MNANAENLAILIDHCASQSAGRIIQLLKAEATRGYSHLPGETVRKLHIVALCKVILALSRPELLFGDEGELLKDRTKEYGLYAGHALGLFLALSERLRSWEPGDPQDELVEAVIDAL
jgi:hypothetical protein